MLLIWERAQWREGESQIVFFKRSCSLAHGLCLKFNACNLLKLLISFYFLVLSFCCISESPGLGWPDLLLCMCVCVCVGGGRKQKKKVAFLPLQPNTILHQNVWHWGGTRGRRCRDPGQLQVRDLLLEWRVADSWMWKSPVCCRPGQQQLTPPWHPATIRSKTWLSRLDVDNVGRPLPLFGLCEASAALSTSAPVVSQLQTLNGVLQEGAVGPWSTEAWRRICMFSHCCINYGWNTDGVLLIYARPTLPLAYLAISKTTDILLPGQEKGLVYLCSEGDGAGRGGGIWGGVRDIIVPQERDSYFDTHTVDSKQPWTNGNSGFFSHYVFYFFMVWKENTNCNLKRSSGQLFFGLCL